MRELFRLDSMILVVAGIAFLAVPAIGHAQTSQMSEGMGKMSADHQQTTLASFDRDSALKISRAAIGRTLDDYDFTSSSGEPVSLADYFGKPILINFIYTSCMHTCPMIVETLSRSVDVARDALGEDSFTVLTIGFDTRKDSVESMAAYARVRGIGDDNWHLLSGDEETVRLLADDLGFLFQPSPMGFDHLAQVSVVDEALKVYRQIYGVKLTAPVVVEPLKQLVFGRNTGYTSFSGLTNQVLLFCTIYDPSTGRYKFDASFIITIVVGLLFLSGAGALFIRSWWSLRGRAKST